MFVKSINLNQHKHKLPLDRPFGPAIIARARDLVARYRVLVSYNADVECYVGEGVELPNAIGSGADEAECLAEVRANMLAIICTMLEQDTALICNQTP